MIDTPARRLRDAVEPIAQQGSGRAARQRWRTLGLGGIEGYVWARSAALGDPSPGVVAATFGVFDGPSIARTYTAARDRCPRLDVLRAREEGAVDSLSASLGDQEDVAWVGDMLLTATADLDGTARSLFSGLRDLPTPATPCGRLWRGADLVREHRGDGHLATCIAAGLTTVEMSVLTELWIGYPLGEYSATRAHSVEAIDHARLTLSGRGWVSGDDLTVAGHEARDAIELATDASQEQLIANLGDSIDRVIAAAGLMAEALITAGAFTSDHRKRLAG